MLFYITRVIAHLIYQTFTDLFHTVLRSIHLHIDIGNHLRGRYNRRGRMRTIHIRQYLKIK